MSNSIGTSPADLVRQLIRPGSRVLHVSRTTQPEIEGTIRSIASECVSSNSFTQRGDFDYAVAVDVLRHIVDDRGYEILVGNLLGTLKPGGALIVYDRNPYDDVEDNAPGTLARGILPIFQRPEVSNAQVLGQEFFDHWCAAFWTNDHPEPSDSDGHIWCVPVSLLIDREGNRAAVGTVSGRTEVSVVGWRDRAKFAFCDVR